MHEIDKFVKKKVYNVCLVWQQTVEILSVLNRINLHRKSTITKTCKLCSEIIHGFFQLSTKTLKLTFIILRLILIAPLFAITSVQFCLMCAYRKIRKSFNWFSNVKKPTELEPVSLFFKLPLKICWAKIQSTIMIKTVLIWIFKLYINITGFIF